MEFPLKRLNAAAAEFARPKGLRSELSFLKDELTLINGFLVKLADVEGELDLQLQEWRNQAREVAYNIEDWIDDWMHHLDRNGANAGSIHERATRLEVQRPSVGQFQKLKARMVDLSERWRRYKLDGWTSLSDLSERWRRYKLDGWFSLPSSETAVVYPVNMDELVGIDGPRDELIKLLLNPMIDAEQQLKVVSIVGSGGLGKTTLAIQVYHRLRARFERLAFIGVSRKPDIYRILRSILSQVSEQADINLPECTVTQLIRALRQVLEDKRYLIIIDDIWSLEAWETIKKAFPENNHDSIIITTTRSNPLARHCCSGDDGIVYEIKPLSYRDSKRLFLRRLFRSEGSCPPPLKEVSDEILKMCGGMPLAINCIASVLTSKEITKQSWEEVMTSLHSASVMDEDMKCLTQILSLSYYDLPPHLKYCLLYLSMFPENHTIDRDRLERKWIAEGFISEERGCPLEEVASKYFEELINRNVIQLLERSINLGVKTCQIHFMMRYLLRVISEQEKFATLLPDSDISSSDVMHYRHLFIHCPDPEGYSIVASSMALCRARSLTVIGHANQILFKHFKRVRVLDLEGCEGLERGHLVDICGMVLLRYLGLGKTQVSELPPQIGELRNLETLDVRETQINMIPQQIGGLHNLKTLDVRKTRVQRLPNEVVRLSKLSHLLVGDKESHEGVKLPEGCSNLASLQVVGTIDLTECSETTVQELGELKKLRELTGVSYDDTKQNDNLLSSLEKCSNLQSFVIFGDFTLSTMHSSFPYDRVVVEKLTVTRRVLYVPEAIANLRFVGILDIKVCKVEKNDLAILGGLTSLHSLVLRLEVLPRGRITVGSSGFSSLENFYFDCRMPLLSFEEGAMPKLKHLQLKFYAGETDSMDMGIAHVSSLEKLTLRYSSWYKSNAGVHAAVCAMIREATEHPNPITLTVHDK